MSYTVTTTNGSAGFDNIVRARAYAYRQLKKGDNYIYIQIPDPKNRKIGGFLDAYILKGEAIYQGEALWRSGKDVWHLNADGTLGKKYT